MKGKRVQGDRIERIAAGEREPFLGLLLLADESEQQVRSYMEDGELFAFFTAEGDEPAGMVLAIPHAPGEIELKAVAVQADRHGRGIGKRMLAMVLDELRGDGWRRVIVGTGNSGIGQLAFYQKAGFRLHHIERDFITPERGYPADIEENGIPMRDMVWMDLEFPARG